MLSVGFMHNFLQIKNVSLNDHKTIKTFSPLHGFSLFAYWRITVVTMFSSLHACLSVMTFSIITLVSVAVPYSSVPQM